MGNVNDLLFKVLMHPVLHKLGRKEGLRRNISATRPLTLKKNNGGYVGSIAVLNKEEI